MLKIIVVKQEVFFQYILMTFLEEILALNLEIKNPTTFFIMYFILFRNKLKKNPNNPQHSSYESVNSSFGFFFISQKNAVCGAGSFVPVKIPYSNLHQQINELLDRTTQNHLLPHYHAFWSPKHKLPTNLLDLVPETLP